MQVKGYELKDIEAEVRRVIDLVQGERERVQAWQQTRRAEQSPVQASGDSERSLGKLVALLVLPLALGLALIMGLATVVFALRRLAQKRDSWRA